MSIADKTTSGSLFLLIFRLGVSIGTEEAVLHALGWLGVQALLLSLGAIAGSILVARLVLLAAPILASRLGTLAPIVSGGETSMDTTLPNITRSEEAEFAIVSVFSGLVLTLLAPVLILALLR